MMLMLNIATHAQAEAIELTVNPRSFSCSTVISFTIAESDTFSLSIFDRWGRVYKQFCDKTYLRAGYYAFHYMSPARLPLGTYVVALAQRNGTHGSVLIEHHAFCDSTSSTPPIDTANIRVYPNPFTDVLHVELGGNKHISFINVNGIIVKQIDTSDTVLMLSDLASGLYLMQINQYGRLVYSTQVVKQ